MLLRYVKRQLRIAQRKLDWQAYWQTNKHIRELEREIHDYQECCPDHALALSAQLDKLLAKRGELYLKLTQEV